MRKWLPLLTICTGTLMLLVDVTIVNVALPDMATNLDTSFTSLQWVVDIYALVLAALLLGIGTVADRIGHRKMYIAGLALFAAASAASGLAGSPGILIGARAVQGVGAAAMFATTFALLNSSYQGRDRGTAYGMWGAVSGAAAAIGPIAGGLLTEHLSWRWIFFVNLPFALAAIALCVSVLPEDSQLRRTPLDWAGMATFTTFAGALTFALIRANEDGWTEGTVLALFALSAVAIIGFVVAESRVAHPLLDLSLLRNGAFVGALVAGFALTAGAFAYLTYASIWMQSVLGMSPVESGLASLPLAVASFITSASIGRLMHGSRNWLAVSLGIVLTGAGGLIVALQLGDGADWKALVAGLIVSGVGVGLAAPTISSTAMAAVPMERGGMAAGAVNSARQLGFALGIAALGSLFSARIGSVLESHAVPGSDQVGHAVAGGQASVIVASAPAGVRDALESTVRVAAVDGLRTTALIAGFLGVIGGIVAGVLIRPRPAESPEPEQVPQTEAAPA
ncbi:DHA2 family efflux MFS transporter permease subunit [Luteipulveratus mongoliensis]|uniref:Multidrug MFS transporter n=1 Tax=Luteipulveratus mongoliensis TaxID=571913 RepID=A0A0K1JLU9_9MICO|nr:DHA2 family efflux MFS transporter permease subunit [Luteipulveratus mongoliensis]AKU17686.1 multidrug MFS transporter [Luteipulveratus mongoliensis]